MFVLEVRAGLPNHPVYRQDRAVPHPCSWKAGRQCPPCAEITQINRVSRAPTISREALAVTKTLAGFGFWPLVAAKCVSRARLGAIWLPLRETRALQAIRREFNLQTHWTTGAERFNNSAVCTFYAALEIWPVFAGIFRDLRREPGYGSV